MTKRVRFTDVELQRYPSCEYDDVDELPSTQTTFLDEPVEDLQDPLKEEADLALYNEIMARRKETDWSQCEGVSDPHKWWNTTVLEQFDFEIPPTQTSPFI